MAATPLEQAGDVAVATYWTEEATVEPLAGAVTVTPAKAESRLEKQKRIQQTKQNFPIT
jgi:hypothetical protein